MKKQSSREIEYSAQALWAFRAVRAAKHPDCAVILTYYASDYIGGVKHT